MYGAPRGPDEWNLSVGSRYTERHRGSLSSRKSTKLQSRSAALIPLAHNQEHHAHQRRTNKKIKRRKRIIRNTEKQRNKKHAHMHEKSDIALKSPQTFSYCHVKKEEHSRAVFSLKYTHSTSTLIMSQPKKENH